MALLKPSLLALTLAAYASAGVLRMAHYDAPAPAPENEDDIYAKDLPHLHPQVACIGNNCCCTSERDGTTQCHPEAAVAQDLCLRGFFKKGLYQPHMVLEEGPAPTTESVAPTESSNTHSSMTKTHSEEATEEATASSKHIFSDFPLATPHLGPTLFSDRVTDTPGTRGHDADLGPVYWPKHHSKTSSEEPVTTPHQGPTVFSDRVTDTPGTREHDARRVPVNASKHSKTSSKEPVRTTSDSLFQTPGVSIFTIQPSQHHTTAGIPPSDAIFETPGNFTMGFAARAPATHSKATVPAWEGIIPLFATQPTTGAAAATTSHRHSIPQPRAEGDATSSAAAASSSHHHSIPQAHDEDSVPFWATVHTTSAEPTSAEPTSAESTASSAHHSIPRFHPGEDIAFWRTVHKTSEAAATTSHRHSIPQARDASTDLPDLPVVLPARTVEAAPSHSVESSTSATAAPIVPIEVLPVGPWPAISKTNESEENQWIHTPTKGPYARHTSTNTSTATHSFINQGIFKRANATTLSKVTKHSSSKDTNVPEITGLSMLESGPPADGNRNDPAHALPKIPHYEPNALPPPDEDNSNPVVKHHGLPQARAAGGPPVQLDTKHGAIWGVNDLEREHEHEHAARGPPVQLDAKHGAIWVNDLEHSEHAEHVTRDTAKMAPDTSFFTYRMNFKNNGVLVIQTSADINETTAFPKNYQIDNIDEKIHGGLISPEDALGLLDWNTFCVGIGPTTLPASGGHSSAVAPPKDSPAKTLNDCMQKHADKPEVGVFPCGEHYQVELQQHLWIKAHDCVRACQPCFEFYAAQGRPNATCEAKVGLATCTNRYGLTK